MNTMEAPQEVRPQEAAHVDEPAGKKVEAWEPTAEERAAYEALSALKQEKRDLEAQLHGQLSRALGFKGQLEKEPGFSTREHTEWMNAKMEALEKDKGDMARLMEMMKTSGGNMAAQVEAMRDFQLSMVSRLIEGDAARVRKVFVDPEGIPSRLAALEGKIDAAREKYDAAEKQRELRIEMARHAQN